jgi:hypothetical protein
MPYKRFRSGLPPTLSVIPKSPHVLGCLGWYSRGRTFVLSKLSTIFRDFIALSLWVCGKLSRIIMYRTSPKARLRKLADTPCVFMLACRVNVNVSKLRDMWQSLRLRVHLCVPPHSCTTSCRSLPSKELNPPLKYGQEVLGYLSFS